MKRERLDWHAVKEMDKRYMREQLAQAGEPQPEVIGVDEISIRKGHVYRIVVSDLERGRPIWFGGVDRSEASMTMCYDFLGEAQAAPLRLAVMDMWKPFRTMTEAHAPQAAILYDKFHVLRHLNEAIDQVRKAEYKPLNTAYCRPENTVALGFVDGLNNKIRVIQRRCYGLRDEDDLHLMTEPEATGSASVRNA